MHKDIKTPHGRFYQSEELTPDQQFNMIDIMTSLCAHRVFCSTRDGLLSDDPEFLRIVFKGLNFRADVPEKMLMCHVDVSTVAKAKKYLRDTLGKIVVKLPEYNSLQHAAEAAPGQGDHKEIITSKAFELILSYALEKLSNDVRNATPEELRYHGYEIGVMK